MQTATMDFKRLFFFAHLQRNINCQSQTDTRALNCKTKGNGKVKNSSAKWETELRNKMKLWKFKWAITCENPVFD